MQGMSKFPLSRVTLLELHCPTIFLIFEIINDLKKIQIFDPQRGLAQKVKSRGQYPTMKLSFYCFQEGLRVDMKVEHS